MTASNFAHLEPDFPTVHAAASSAERLAMTEPEAAAILAGKAVELALGWAFANDAALTPPAQFGASRMINDPDLKGIMGQKVHAKARFINLVRNKSAHEGSNLKFRRREAGDRRAAPRHALVRPHLCPPPETARAQRV